MPLVEAYKTHVYKTSGLPEEAKLKQTNSFFNQFHLKTDLENYGVVDYWASPLEFLNKRGGDCEDYAITKALTLVAEGVSPNKLKVAYVMASSFNNTSAHMVLLYSTENNDPLVLDNLIDDIRPLSARRDLSFKFSFDLSGIPDQSSTPQRIPRWQSLLIKTKQEGFLN